MTPERSGVELYPSIDLRGGRVVRLLHGDFGQQIEYGNDPVAVARRFADAGAVWVHVVDLDAARTGSAHHRDVVAAIVAAVAGRAEVQAGGGVRSVADAAAMREAGVARVVMGSAAVARPALAEEVAAVLPVAIGLDHRAGELAVHGWTESSGRRIDELVNEFPSASAFIVTDICRDGALGGPDVEGVRRLAAFAPAPVIASGGVACLDDVVTLAAIPGVIGVITGRAVYEGSLDLAAAVAGARRAGAGRR